MAGLVGVPVAVVVAAGLVGVPVAMVFGMPVADCMPLVDRSASHGRDVVPVQYSFLLVLVLPRDVAEQSQTM